VRAAVLLCGLTLYGSEARGGLPRLFGVGRNELTFGASPCTKHRAGKHQQPACPYSALIDHALNSDLQHQNKVRKAAARRLGMPQPAVS
jgi:hypothetical protein